MKKYLIFILISILAAAVTAQENVIEEFWDFVTQNEVKISKASNLDHDLWNALNQKIQKINPQLYVMANTAREKTELVISTGGNAENFPLCDIIVESAPDYANLAPISLIPRVEKFEPFIYHLGEDTISFFFEEVRVHYDDGEKIELVLILSPDHYRRIHENSMYDLENFYYNMCVQMLMQALGERLMGERISSITLMPMYAMMPSIPLVELSEHIR